MGVSQSLTLTQSSQNIAGNSSAVRILWKSTQSGESHNNYTREAKYYVSVNGGAETVYTVKYTLPKGTTKTILDTTITVPHKADGTGTVKVRTWMDTQLYEGVVTQSKTLTLDDIAKATMPTFYSDTVEMGKTATIYLYGSDPNFVHDLYYAVDDAGVFDLIAQDVGTAYYWKVPDLAEKLPNQASAQLMIICQTKLNGQFVGERKGYFNITVPEDVMPTITSVDVTEATEGLAAQFGAFVKGKSTLAVSVKAEGAKGSTIKSSNTVIEGKIYHGLRFTSGVPLKAGVLNLDTTVVDTRGRITRETTRVAVLDYYLPTIPKLVAYRVDANGNPKSDGDYLCIDYAYDVAPVGNKNTALMTLEYKRSTASSWSTLMTSGAYSVDAVRSFTTKLSSDYQFDIQLKVADWFGAEATYPASLPTAKVILDFKANGKGIAAGKTSEFDGFEMAMPADCESFHMIGVRNYELGSGYGHVLYNNGLLIQWGSVSVTPTAVNTVTQLRTIFPIPYATRPHITGTLLANSPQVVSWAMGVGNSETEALTGLVVYMTRSTLHATPFRWMAVGLVDPTKLPEVTA